MVSIDLDYISKYNVELGWGYYFEYHVFKKNIEPYLTEILKLINHDYVSIIKEGELNFCHYGPSGINKINPSTFESKNYNLTLCEGVYCYNSDEHKPVKCEKGISLYYGKYKGKYVECIMDSDGNGINDKSTGNLKGHVLLCNSPVEFYREFEF